jgi:hypothetical protein
MTGWLEEEEEERRLSGSGIDSWRSQNWFTRWCGICLQRKTKLVRVSKSLMVFLINYKLTD